MVFQGKLIERVLHSGLQQLFLGDRGALNGVGHGVCRRLDRDLCSAVRLCWGGDVKQLILHLVVVNDLIAVLVQLLRVVLPQGKAGVVDGRRESFPRVQVEGHILSRVVTDQKTEIGGGSVKALFHLLQFLSQLLPLHIGQVFHRQLLFQSEGAGDLILKFTAQTVKFRGFLIAITVQIGDGLKGLQAEYGPGENQRQHQEYRRRLGQGRFL